VPTPGVLSIAICPPISVTRSFMPVSPSEVPAMTAPAPSKPTPSSITSIDNSPPEDSRITPIRLALA
jgi:hypothetical protein